ncbi:MAG: hypothetical protein PHD43_15445 [Methylococcales bacterium]|jgi:hypothetical protein|nr:hypothetical protein [Methylococcales bacterium]
MNKRTYKNDGLNTSSILYAALTMIIFSLLVAWSVELLMKELFRLG